MKEEEPMGPNLVPGTAKRAPQGFERVVYERAKLTLSLDERGVFERRETF